MDGDLLAIFCAILAYLSACDRANRWKRRYRDLEDQIQQLAKEPK